MSSFLFDRRFSDRFDELFDAPGAARRTHRRTAYDSEVGPLVALGRRLQGLPESPAPDPEFRTQLRTFLLARAARDGLGCDSNEATTVLPYRAPLAGATQVLRPVPGRRTRRARAAIMIGITSGAIALSGVSAASSDSIPGDPLYQVKRSAEQAQLALAGSDQSRGQLLLEFARNRLAEAQQVTGGRVTGVLADMDGETQQGVYLLTGAAIRNEDPAALPAIRDFVTQQRDRLTALRDILPLASAGETVRSLDLLDTVEDRIVDLIDALARGCVITAADSLGPKPVGC